MAALQGPGSFGWAQTFGKARAETCCSMDSADAFLNTNRNESRNPRIILTMIYCNPLTSISKRNTALFFFKFHQNLDIRESFDVAMNQNASEFVLKLYCMYPGDLLIQKRLAIENVKQNETRVFRILDIGFHTSPSNQIGSFQGRRSIHRFAYICSSAYHSSIWVAL